MIQSFTFNLTWSSLEKDRDFGWLRVFSLVWETAVEMWRKTSRKCNLWLQHQLTCRWKKRCWKRSATISPATPRLHKSWTGIRVGKEPRNSDLIQQPHTEISTWRSGVGGAGGRPALWQLRWWSQRWPPCYECCQPVMLLEQFPCSLELWYCGLRAHNLPLVLLTHLNRVKSSQTYPEPLAHLLSPNILQLRLLQLLPDTWLSAASFSQRLLPASTGQ